MVQMFVHRWVICLICCLKWVIIGNSDAHEPLASWTAARISPDALILEVVLTPGEARLLVTDYIENPPYIYPDNFEEIRPLFLEYAIVNLFEIVSDGHELHLDRFDVSYDADKDDVIFWLYYPKPNGERLDFRARYLDLMPEEHEATLMVTDGDGTSLGWELLIQGNDRFGVSLKSTAPVSLWATFKRFFMLGVEHIVFGYDHLLFLGGLIVACRCLKEMVVIISCFSLAHSLTLGMAALDLIVLSGNIVEPLIAASIVYVGVENFLRVPQKRWLLTLVFGLVHGFGFAGILRETGLGTKGWDLIAPLFAFNLGVEVGQLFVAMFVLPLILYLRKGSFFTQYGFPTLSGCVTLMGGYWFVVRVFFS